MTEERVERRLAAILAADVEGYSRLMEADEVGTLLELMQRRAILDSLIATHRGRIANTAGDSVLAEFGSAVDAVQCAVEAQTALAEANVALSQDHYINFRIGVHVGDVMVKSGDLFGDGINIAARLQTLARAGGICISGVAHDQVRKILPFAFTDLGAQQVKNIEEPVRVFAVTTKGASPIRASSNASVPLALPDKPSIAVLPFQNMSGDQEQEYFADGMVEDITTALSRTRRLFVIARNSSFTYKGKAVDIKKVGRELGVRYVLEGSVRKSGNRIRITGQLIEASTGIHIWAERFDGLTEDLFELQDQITAKIVGLISPKLQQIEIERSLRKLPENFDAYDYYLQGTAKQNLLTEKGGNEALPLFLKSIEADPTFAPAYSQVAMWYANRKAQGWSEDIDGDIKASKEYTKRALELDRNDPSVLARVGWVIAYLVGDSDSGAALLDQAADLDPNWAPIWVSRGWVNIHTGDHPAAIICFQRALRLSPLDPLRPIVYEGLACANFFLDRYDEAAQWADSAVREKPDYIGVLRIAIACLAASGRRDEAVRMWVETKYLHPNERISQLRTPLRRVEDVAKLSNSLRAAGMPE